MTKCKMINAEVKATSICVMLLMPKARMEV